jgi:hypothetical protein
LFVAVAYVQGVRRGGVMVFASGPGKKADKAAEIMNSHGAVEIEKISAARPALPDGEIDEETIVDTCNWMAGQKSPDFNPMD